SGLYQRAAIGGCIQHMHLAGSGCRRLTDREVSRQRQCKQASQQHTQHKHLAALATKRPRRGFIYTPFHLPEPAFPVKDLSVLEAVWEAAVSAAERAARDCRAPSSPASSRAIAAVWERTT